MRWGGRNIGEKTARNERVVEIIARNGGNKEGEEEQRRNVRVRRRMKEYRNRRERIRCENKRHRSRRTRCSVN
jgi:hypothetical protein